MTDKLDEEYLRLAQKVLQMLGKDVPEESISVGSNGSVIIEFGNLNKLNFVKMAMDC